MKQLIKCKIALVLIVAVFAFASAQNSVSVNIDARTKVENVGGAAGPATFVDGGSNLDTLKINFKAVVDNVTAEVGFTGSPVAFDYATLTVADLLDGMLTVKAFDIGYSAGNNEGIRPDFGSQGMKFIVKPIDMLSIGLGYGIGTRDFPVVSSSNIMPLSSVNYHAIQLDIGVNNAFVPATVYGGAVIFDGSGQKYRASATATDPETIKIFHASVGLSADLLAALMPGMVKLDVGLVLPNSVASMNSTYSKDLNMSAILYGSASDLGVEGLGLAYALTFAPDTETKAVTLGDMDGVVDGDSFRELLKVSITPSYTIGQFKVAVEGIFGMVGEKTAMVGQLYTEAYNSFEVTPSVTWSPGGGSSVKTYFTYGKPNMKVSDQSTMTLGMNVGMNFGVTAY